MEKTVPIENIVALVLITGMFLAFMGTLAWVSETEDRIRERRASQPPQPSPRRSPQAPRRASHA